MTGAVFQNNLLCDRAEADGARVMRETLADAIVKLCADFPGLCIKEACESKQLVTEQVVIRAEMLTSDCFEGLSQHAVNKVCNAFVVFQFQPE